MFLLTFKCTTEQKFLIYEVLHNQFDYAFIKSSGSISRNRLGIYLNSFTYQVTDSDKTIYSAFIPLYSGVESQFAKDNESSDQIKFYFKLPNWFKIPTPIGNYNSDWAIVYEEDKKIYFVAETKDTGTPMVDFTKLSADEQMKIKCGKAHFNYFNDLEYKVVNKVGQLVD
jgi:type III restriction enzyme